MGGPLTCFISLARLGADGPRRQVGRGDSRPGNTAGSKGCLRVTAQWQWLGFVLGLERGLLRPTPLGEAESLHPFPPRLFP